jgi:hypothetical protein
MKLKRIAAEQLSQGRSDSHRSASAQARRKLMIGAGGDGAM